MTFVAVLLVGLALLFPLAAVFARGEYRRGRPPNPPQPGVQHHVHHHFHHVSGEVRVVHVGAVQHEHTHCWAGPPVAAAQPALRQASAALPSAHPRVVEGTVLNGQAIHR